MLKPSKNEIRKPTKTISGITPVAVMLPPLKCRHGTCIYCPSLNVPQSYTPRSPVVMRASQVNYNAFKQVRARIKAFQIMHHPTEKIELIIMGGTFLEYPKNFQYRFIKQCYDALNENVSKNLIEAQKKNEKARHRCVALCIETRPDVCVKYIDRLREFGCTRVELGVQMPDDEIYKKIKRKHSVKDVAEATKSLKNTGFKVGYHIMPGLPGSDMKKDLQLFKKIFNDERFKPDQIKIYPCQVIKGSELEKLYYSREYKPYTKEQTKKILVEMLKIVPRYCRVMRVMREIPPEYLIAGTTRIDLRKDIEEEMRKKNIKLEEIRYREVGFAQADNLSSLRSDINKNLMKNMRDSSIINSKKSRVSDSERGKSNLKLKITKYKASEGEEYFLEIVNDNDILFGLLRLRIFDDYSPATITPTKLTSPFKQSHDVKLVNLLAHPKEKIIIYPKKSRASSSKRGKVAIIRELHVYGQALKIGEENEIASQHKGLGKRLIKKAEQIAKKSKVKEIYVIAGIGVKEYFYKLGYKPNESYVSKKL